MKKFLAALLLVSMVSFVGCEKSDGEKVDDAVKDGKEKVDDMKKEGADALKKVTE